MRGSLFGWGKEHGRFAHVLIQTGIQVALWSLVFTIVSRPGGITYKLFLQDFPILLFTSVALILLGLRSGGLPRVPDVLSGRLVLAIAIAVLLAIALTVVLILK